MRNAAKKPVHPGLSAIVAAMILLASLASAQTPVVKAVGTVKSVSGNSVTLTTDSGVDQAVTFGDTARIVRAVPGQTDLKTATPITVSDIQVGDRVFARGQAGEGNAVIASSVIVMKQSDIAEKQQRERDEWRKGVGGIVKGMDVAANTVTIANAMVASGKPIVIHISAQTEVRRRAPDSVKFDDAKPGTLDQIKPGDSLQARGTKNADGTEFTAQAIVSGTFRDIAGTVVSTDAANSTITITDLATKKPVTVKVTSDSQLRKLPQPMAMGIAMRLKGGAPGAAAGAGAPGQGGGNWSGGGQGNWRGGATSAAGSAQGGSGGAGMGNGQAGAPGGQGGAGGNWRGGGGGTPDFQQILSRAPVVTISDLNKGDALILVATEGSATSGPTAITLVAGVEAILSATPPGTSASTILSPWNLSAPAGAGGD
jgi:hypothetical protein